MPDIDYDWTLNDALIPHPHQRSAAAASRHSADELATSSKFVISLDGTELSLTIKNPSMCTSHQQCCSVLVEYINFHAGWFFAYVTSLLVSVTASLTMSFKNRCHFEICDKSYVIQFC